MMDAIDKGLRCWCRVDLFSSTDEESGSISLEGRVAIEDDS